ncbi:membrane protein [Sphaerisporangium rufum]|uniref:Membrane protein n=1 Tax=Sphaerisporangium rufum TaxID=1381558 RepID=A0A919QZI9_9ACTN|nr:thioredoxin domain-containing protein [Sphaerisporangium rufum]GII76909.1 membrane protein [Sphaerisporangium rufum]
MGKAARDLSARERIKSQRERQRRQDQRRRVITAAAVAAVVLAVIAGGWFYVQSGRSETATEALAPVAAQPDGTVVMAKQGVAKPVVDVYEDFQCPACQAFEQTSGPTLKNLAAEGQVKVVYHPITIFGNEPTKGNSTRAASAARCVPDGRQWLAFHDRLFKEQPSETKPGFALDDLVTWGKDSGVTDPGFESCVRTQKQAQAHAAFSKKVLDSGVITKGTPTVMLNGKELENSVAFSPDALRKAVTEAAKRPGTR